MTKRSMHEVRFMFCSALSFCAQEVHLHKQTFMGQIIFCLPFHFYYPSFCFHFPPLRLFISVVVEVEATKRRCGASRRTRFLKENRVSSRQQFNNSKRSLPKTGYHKFSGYTYFPFAVLNFNLIKKRFQRSRFKTKLKRQKKESEIIILQFCF